MQPNLTWPTHPTKNKAKPPQHQPNLFHEMPSGVPCPTWCTQVNQLSQYDSAPQDKIPANWKNILKPKGKETLQNQFSIGKVKPEINTSPMTNIWYYAHTQKQTSLFPFKSQEKKEHQKLFRRLFGKDRNDSIILHSNFPCHQTRNSGKISSRENVKTHYEPWLRTDI